MAFSISKFNSPQSSNRQQQQQQHSSVDQFKQRILVQNRALAKKNSFLMTKISDLETKVSDLIQQNIELRALNAKSEDKKRRWFEEKLGVIEDGVSQRFDEIFQMFSIIRSNEGLPPPNVKQSRLINDITHDTHSSDKTVSFQNAKSPKSAARSERRRKSLRRQSIYVAPPSPPALKEGYDQDDVEERNDVSQAAAIEPEFKDNNERKEREEEKEQEEEEIRIHFNDENPFDEQSLPVISTEDNELKSQQTGSQELLDKAMDDLEQASNLSPIKFSSPRLEEQLKKSTFEVYEDSPKLPLEDFNEKIQKLVSQSILPSTNTIRTDTILAPDFDDELSDEQKPLLQNVDKVKHTKSKKQKPKSSVDEQMPESIIEAELSTRKSRTRGKSISYAEPSLRAKMRRQSEKFVDAVVQDAFVKGVSRYSFGKTTSSEENSSSDNQTPEQNVQNDNNSATENNNSISDNAFQKFAPNEPITHQIPNEKSPVKLKNKSLIEQDSLNITKRRKPLSALTQNTNKVSKISDKPMNKLHVEVDEADLSAFDLVEESAAGVPKTYKGKPEITTKKKSTRRHSMLL